MKILKTEHPHIIRKKTAGGVTAIIKQTGISVRIIAGYYKLGMSTEEILEAFPHLKLAQIYDAISYYHDHIKEIEKEFKGNTLEYILKAQALKINRKGFIKPKNISNKPG